MKREEEKLAIFWCDLLSPIIFSEIEPEGVNRFLKEKAQEVLVFPNGEVKKPSLSLLRRKLNRFKEGGFNALAKKPRSDRGKPRTVGEHILEKAIELKKDQPYRSDKTINRFLKEMYGVTIARSTLYRHLKEGGATRIKLGISRQKVRKRWTRDHTHDLWVGDFEEGPYVMENNEVLPTYLSGFIDCHSRYAVEGRYYLRQNLDVLIDSLIRALSKHGAPLELYLDNAKVYHSHGLRAACYKMNTRLIHRKKGDPAPGGLIERFFQTAQGQFEAEVRHGDILSLSELNRNFSAWLEMGYQQEIHSEIQDIPKNLYQSGLLVNRQVDMREILSSFMQRVDRTVNRTFSDVRLNNRYYKVDARLRGDRVEVRYDPFTGLDIVEIYSLKEVYLGEGKLHFRQQGGSAPIPSSPDHQKHNYLDLVLKQHNKYLADQTKGIDYRKASESRAWPFHEFAKTFATLLGRKGGLTGFTADELERLKKVYNQSTSINREMVRQAFSNAYQQTVPYIIHELKQILKGEQ